ncbi:hypothetical protein P7C70_g1428, partial [Phenoliferia sp. Uapishka_3]
MSRQGARSTAVPKFYLNKTIESFAQRPSTPISLKHLINFGTIRSKTPAEESARILKGGNFLRTELPTRLSHRLRDIQSLPFVVASHPRLELVYNMYLDAFEGIRKFPVLKTLEDNDAFCAFMQSTLDTHRSIIPELAIGIAESSPLHLPPPALDTFMTRMLRSRISRRVITEQHIALTSQFRERQAGIGRGWKEGGRVGVVDTVRPADTVRQCVELVRVRGGPEAGVEVRLEGDLEASFAYIPEHLEFMIFELLKAAIFATTSHHGPLESRHHPVVVTMVDGPKELLIRVSDEGGGIEPWGGLSDPLANPFSSTPSSPPLLVSQRLEVFSFSHMRRLYLHHSSNPPPPADPNSSSSSKAKAKVKQVSDEVGIMALRNVGKMAGTVKEQLDYMWGVEEGGEEMKEAIRGLMDVQMKSGIGLPLAKMFAEYLSGTLQLHTMMGHGSDQLLSISKFGHAA